ncbi:MAG: plasmid stabilization protein [Roseovarius confluentis]|uniref:FitA-like ribbon-helix-helix domain-containing protein n=1 Tax=Roseovarius sp. TaxID=1486281 RepID=UPI0032ED1930
MANITIRCLDDEVKRRLRVRVAEYSMAMDEEALEILCPFLALPVAPKNLGQAMHMPFAKIRGEDLQPPARWPMRGCSELVRPRGRKRPVHFGRDRG